jgi:hypothetical protein
MKRFEKYLFHKDDVSERKGEEYDASDEDDEDDIKKRKNKKKKKKI